MEYVNMLNYGFYELKLVCLAWDESQIGWLVEYWYGIMMFQDNM